MDTTIHEAGNKIAEAQLSQKEVPESMFDAHPKMKSFTKLDESKAHYYESVIDPYV